MFRMHLKTYIWNFHHYEDAGSGENNVFATGMKMGTLLLQKQKNAQYYRFLVKTDLWYRLRLYYGARADSELQVLYPLRWCNVQTLKVS